MTRPLVLLPACHRTREGLPAHEVLRQYVEAARLAGGLPLALPWLEADEIDDALDLADGVLLTGSPSNVHPSHFGEAVHDPALPLDPARDAWVLPLIRRAVERGVPLLGICRGAQEVNVALGGSLHQAVQEVPGMADHRDDPDAPTGVQWGPSHRADVVQGGLLEGLLGTGPITVNSLHGQGVNRLADGLRVEALAPDGLIEAFSIPRSPAFALCVQWHPEWHASSNPVSMRLLEAFGHALRQRQAQRAGGAFGTHATR